MVYTQQYLTVINRVLSMTIGFAIDKQLLTIIVFTFKIYISETDVLNGSNRPNAFKEQEFDIVLLHDCETCEKHGL